MGSDDSEELDNRDRVLEPDDLDITNRPEVAEIDDGRYVVSPNGPAKQPDRELLENPDWLSNDDSEDTDSQPPATQSSARHPPAQDNQKQSSARHPPTQHPQGQSSQPPQADPGRQPSQSHPSADHQPPGQPPANESSPPPSPDQPSRGSREPTQPQDSPQSTQPSRGSRSPRSQQPTQSTHPQRSSSRAHSSGQSPSQPAPSAGKRTDAPTNRELAAHDQPPAEPPAAEITNENVSRFLAQSLANASGEYGFDATLNVEGQVNRGRMTSDDIGETLETLLRWYAKQTTDEVEPEHVLGIILAGSDLAVEYPVQSAYEVVKQHGLGPDDTISDLLSAVREDGSFTVPPSKD